MKDVVNIDNTLIGELLEIGADKGNYVGNSFMLITDTRKMRPLIRLGQPYRTNDGRIVRVTHGTGTYRINLIDYLLKEHDIMVVPPNSLIELESHSEDFAIEILAVSELPGVDINGFSQVFPNEAVLLSLDNKQWEITNSYFWLIGSILQQQQYSSLAVSHIILSLSVQIATFNHFSLREQSNRKPSRNEETFRRFIKLLNQYGTRERNIPFYADRLSLTPNHLSVVIRHFTGQTVMQWIHRTTIMEAKVLLRHSHLKIYEIAHRLNFDEPTAFSRYYKKHIGITPLEYRDSN